MNKSGWMLRVTDLLECPFTPISSLTQNLTGLFIIFNHNSPVFSSSFHYFAEVNDPQSTMLPPLCSSLEGSGVSKSMSSVSFAPYMVLCTTSEDHRNLYRVTRVKGIQYTTLHVFNLCCLKGLKYHILFLFPNNSLKLSMKYTKSQLL